jgi:cellulose synthase/poly-beta-1,6-N-acetylglucosamine synthase-like glycosyltransferase
MSEAPPPVTIIIAAKPGQQDILAVDAARTIDYPRDRLELIVARGTQPAIQRNAAIRAARGELVYFLDDDSVPLPGNLRRAVAHFARPEVAMVGGPNVCPPEAPPLEQAFARVMASWLAFGPSRARYTPVGTLRETSEKELILCNQMARRSVLLQHGGFDEALYPNEENALMDDIQAQGGKLLYDPELVVQRRPRRTLGAFARMLRNYGRGRAEQFRLHPTAGSAPNFVPPLFCVYLLAAPFVLPWSLGPLGLYALAVLAQTAVLRHCSLATIWRVPPLIFLTHVCYGLGFWRGLFTRLKASRARTDVPVTLEPVPLA